MSEKLSQIDVSLIVVVLAGLTYFCPTLDAGSQCATSGSADLF